MDFRSKKVSLIILAVTALLSSRAMFAFFNDPEGPNLLIVVVLAAVVYLLSWAAYTFLPLATGFKKLSLAVLVQIVIVVVLYFLGR